MSAVKPQNGLYRIAICHYLIAALFFLALAILFLFSVEELSGHYFQPKILALTHIAALGWGSIIIFGTLYQLLPFILETRLFSLKLSWLSLAFFVPGVILLVYCFWVFNPGVYMQIASFLLFAAVVSFDLNVFLTVKDRKQDSMVTEFILTSCLWLSLTVLLGGLMVFNFTFSFLPKDHLQFLRLHAHMGIAGWFLMLIIGVSAKLLPMFLVSKYQKTHLLSYSYYLINAALLLFILDGYFYGINFKTYVISFLGVLGICFYLAFVYQCVTTRIRANIDLPMVQTLGSFVLLGLAILTLPFLLYYHLKQHPLATNLSVFYGVLIFMGWISSLISGQTFKILPYIVWLKCYEHLTGKVKTPMPADLINNSLLNLQFVAFLVFLLSFMTGFLLSSDILKYLAAGSLLLMALCYSIHVLCLLLHPIKTEKYEPSRSINEI
jgi:hypothetical protein